MDEVAIDGRKLRLLRGDMGQTELAKLSGISQSYISRLEAGKKTNVSIAKLGKLAKALNVPVIELIADTRIELVTGEPVNLTRQDVHEAVERALGGQSMLSERALDRIVTEIMRQEIKKASERRPD